MARSCNNCEHFKVGAQGWERCREIQEVLATYSMHTAQRWLDTPELGNDCAYFDELQKEYEMHRWTSWRGVLSVLGERREFDGKEYVDVTGTGASGSIGAALELIRRDGKTWCPASRHKEYMELMKSIEEDFKKGVTSAEHKEPGRESGEETQEKGDKEIQKIEIEKRELGMVLDHCVYVVDGDVIRNWIMVDFTTGGNPAVYDFVPEGELWVENGMALDDIAPCIVHEYTECWLMRHNGLSYDDAHDLANVQERWFRGDLSEGNIPQVKSVQEALDTATQRIQTFLDEVGQIKEGSLQRLAWDVKFDLERAIAKILDKFEKRGEKVRMTDIIREVSKLTGEFPMPIDQMDVVVKAAKKEMAKRGWISGNYDTM